MRLLAALLFSVLAACASPSQLRSPSQVVDVAGSRFRVYMLPGSDKVEAHRISVEVLPSRSLTLAKAVRAIEIATGCGVRLDTVDGDQAIVTASVDCTLF